MDTGYLVVKVAQSPEAPICCFRTWSSSAIDCSSIDLELGANGTPYNLHKPEIACEEVDKPCQAKHDSLKQSIVQPACSLYLL